MRRHINRAYALLYCFIFLSIGVMTVGFVLNHCAEKAFLTYEYRTATGLAAMVNETEGPVIRYSYFVDGREFNWEEPPALADPWRPGNTRTVEVFYSPRNPEFATLKKPGGLELLWTVIKDLGLLVVVVFLCLTGSVMMFMEGAKAEETLDEIERQKKIRRDSQKVGRLHWFKRLRGWGPFSIL